MALDKDVCITGEQLREITGGLKEWWDDDKNEMDSKIRYQQKFNYMSNKIRVISRCTPEDKLSFV